MWLHHAEGSPEHLHNQEIELMDTLVVGVVAAAPPSPVLDWTVILAAAGPLAEWLPVLLLAAGMLWLAYATRTRRAETLNERNEREVEEGRR